jgi:2-methylisocitrate lyase-like PEP mutase family enzyme
MPVSIADKRATFHKMHEAGCFVLPNPYDIGTARALQQLGFKALASTSAGFAWTIGKSDNQVTLDEVCTHLTAICGAVDLPVNADFEGGYAHEADKVAANVARAVKTGVAGLSIEDSTGAATKPLYERAHAIERIKAARAAIDADNSRVLLTGRCEGFLVGQTDLDMVIDRLKAYSAAGADCLYAPGITTTEQISAIVKAVHPKPVNLLIRATDLSLAEAEGLGVRRISVGGSLARAAWAAFMRAAREMAEKGTFTELASGYPGAELNKMFR